MPAGEAGSRAAVTMSRSRGLRSARRSRTAFLASDPVRSGESAPGPNFRDGHLRHDGLRKTTDVPTVIPLTRNVVYVETTFSAVRRPAPHAPTSKATPRMAPTVLIH